MMMSIPMVLSAAPRVETMIYKDQAGKPVPYAGTVAPNSKVLIPTQYHPKTTEARGAWVATVQNIDFGKHRTAASFKKQFTQILDDLKSKNFNFIVFQVRPTNDAFYRSGLNPWSRFLTGEEGVEIKGFDPLAFMIEETHKRGMQFHAWLNPYRVVGSTDQSKSAYLNSLSDKNFARQNPHLVLDVPKNGQRTLILNPGEPEVIKFVVDTVRELASNYDVDAIHFDDYFYPYGGVGNVDKDTYQRQNKRQQSIEDWRRENVNTLIQSVSRAIAANNRINNKQVQFGISPFGIWANYSPEQKFGSLTRGSEALNSQYADTRRWVKEGWIDYIAPQLYWPFAHKVAAYAALADWWAYTVRGTNVNLYIGMAPYRLGEESIWQNPMEIVDQLRYNGKYPEIKGEIFFSYRNIANPGNAVMKKGLEQVWKNCWNKPAALPACGPFKPKR